MSKQNYKRLNLALDKDLHKIISLNAKHEYMPITTYLKRYLKQNLKPVES